MSDTQAQYWKERWDRKTRKEALEWLAFKDFINETPDAKKLARPKGTYAMHYKALVVAYEVFIAKTRKGTRREKKNILTYRWAAFFQTIMRRCEIKTMLPLPVESQPRGKSVQEIRQESKVVQAPAMKPGPRRGEIGHKDRISGVFGGETGWAEVVSSPYIGMPPELHFTPDKKRPKLKPGEALDIFTATDWKITSVPSGDTPGWFNEYWGCVSLRDGKNKFIEILDGILGRVDECESCDPGYHPAIRTLWAECVSGILARLRGEPPSGTSEAWQAGYNADVEGFSADWWDGNEGRFIRPEEAAS